MDDDRNERTVEREHTAPADERTRPVRDRAVPRRPAVPAQPTGEVDGPKGPEPTRYGDWEKGGRCSDF